MLAAAVRLIRSPWFKIIVGFILVASCLVQLYHGVEEEVALASHHVVFILGIGHILIACGTLIDGLRQVDEGEEEEHWRRGWLLRVVATNVATLAMGGALLFGSLFELTAEIEELAEPQAEHGLVIFAVLSMFVSLSELILGTRSIVGGEERIRERRAGTLLDPIRRFASHPAHPIIADAALLLMTAAELARELDEGRIEFINENHGLLVFAIAHLLESLLADDTTV